MVEGFAGAQAIALQLADLYASPRVRSILNVVPAPTSLPMPMRTLFCQQAGKRNSPLPRNRFDVGQKASAEPVSCRHCHSASAR